MNNSGKNHLNLSELQPGRRSFALLCVVVFAAVLILTALTPMVSDDFAYCFSWADWTRIRHVGQIIPSMAEHRNVTNGRVLVHGLVQLLLLLPRPIFVLLNALNAVLLCLLAGKLLVGFSGKHTTAVVLAGVLGFCCFLPALGENLFWLDGSLNYFWGLSVSLLFLYPFLAEYLGLEYRHTAAGTALRLLLAFIFGTWSENASLVFLFLACSLFLLQWKSSRRFQLVRLLWILAAIAGYLFLMSAPATAGRAGASAISVIGYNFRVVFRAARTYLLWPLMINAVLFCLALFFQTDRKLLMASGLLFTAAVLSHLSYVFAAYFVPRHLCSSLFLLTLSSALLLAGLCQVGKPVFSAVVPAALSVLFLLQFPVGVLDVAISYHKQQLREQQISAALAAGERDVVLENYYPYTAYAVPFELNPVEPSVGPNINVAEYYGLDSVLGIDPPEES